MQRNETNLTLEDIENLDTQIEETLLFLNNESTQFLNQQTMTKVQFKKQKKYYTKNLSLSHQTTNINITVKNIDDSIQTVSIPQYCFCPVCLEPFQFPITLHQTCKHTICAFCLLQSSIQWSFKKCPCCGNEYEDYVVNILLQNDISSFLKRHILAQKRQNVIVLSKYEKINSFSFGFLQKLENGYIKENMVDWVQSDIVLDTANLVQPQVSKKKKKGRSESQNSVNDSQNSAQQVLYINTQIATVYVNQSVWQGPINSVFPINYKYFQVCTRPLRGGFVIQRYDVQITKQEAQNSLDVQEYVYEPEKPKFISQISNFINVANYENIYMLLADEPVLNTIQLIQNNVKTSSSNLDEYLRIGIDINFHYQSDLSCPACKQYYRVPVQLICGCNCCFTCAKDLFSLQLPCLGCGQKILKKYGLNSVNKKLILQIYAKIPSFSPMIDKAMPVFIDEQLGILIDDPSRVNCWILLGPGQTTYVHTIKLKAITVTKLLTALRPKSGIIYRDKQFAILTQQQNQNIICSRDDINGTLVSNNVILLNSFKIIDDIRTEILDYKLKGRQLQEQKIEAEYIEIKDKVQKKIIADNIKQAEKQTQKQFTRDPFEERRKKLNLVSYNDQKSKNHPCNQMVPYDSNKQTKQVINYIHKESKNWILETTLQHPELTFLCSGCWEYMKSPVILKCGHTCCRICACIYIQSQNPCLVCQSLVTTLQETQFDQELSHELIAKLDNKNYHNGLDIGQFVEFKDEIFMVTKFSKSGVVEILSKGVTKNVKISSLRQKQPGNFSLEMAQIGDFVQITEGQLQGFNGILISESQIMVETQIILETFNLQYKVIEIIDLVISIQQILENSTKNEQLRRNQIAMEIKAKLLEVDHDVSQVKVMKNKSVSQISSKKQVQKQILSKRDIIRK